MLIEDTQRRKAKAQEEVSKKIADRLEDIYGLTLGLRKELEANDNQTQLLVQAFKHLEFVMAQSKRPLKIALKCLNIREEKVDIENVKDFVVPRI